jgi:hypothetical protein
LELAHLAVQAALANLRDEVLVELTCALAAGGVIKGGSLTATDIAIKNELRNSEHRSTDTGFDATCIVHFSPTDFVTVVDRCERLAINMFGIEVFDGKPVLRAVNIRPNDPRAL